MKKWLPSLIAVGGSALTIFMPNIQAFIGANPTLATVLIGAFTVLSHVLQSPVAPAVKPE